MSTKTCAKCNFSRPLSAFHKDKTCKDGRRNTCRGCMGGTTAKVVKEEKPKRFFRPLASKRYLITSAQNNTEVHEPFFAALKAAAEHLGAELVVIPFRYKNPTGLQPGTDMRLCESVLRRTVRYRGQDVETCQRFKFHEGPCSYVPDPTNELWWDKRLEPFLHNVRKKLNPNLVMAADIKIQPTASSPLTGFESLTGAESCIIGHPKMQFKTVPVPAGRYPKILTTTGACTVRNYSNTKAGALGEFHHYLGALVVEIQGKKFHLRQINADRLDGSFIDLNQFYSALGAVPAMPALGLVMGDTHVRVKDPAVDAATFGPGGMVEVLNPKTLVFHDVFDGETVNPHDVGDPFIAEAKRRAGRQEVRAELQQVVDFLNERAKGRDVVIVDSNHHDFLRRWMVKTDWRQDLKNADFYLKTAQAMLESARMEAGGAEYADPFTYWVGKLGCASNVQCLHQDESFQLGGNECGLHGHAGPNGAKGTLKNLSRLGVRTVSGHTHTPGIEEGGYQVGTSSVRRLAYMRGPSSHLNTHCVIYANGKRALLSVVEGSFRLE